MDTFNNFSDKQLKERLTYFRENTDLSIDIVFLLETLEYEDQLELYKNFFDFLTEDEIYDFYELKEVITNFIYNTIDNYDYDIFKYLINDNQIVKVYYSQFIFFWEIINKLQEKNLFYFIEIIIMSSANKNDNDMCFYGNLFNSCILENSLYKVKFMVENLKIKPIYLINGIFLGLNFNHLKMDVAKYLINMCIKCDFFEDFKIDIYNNLTEINKIKNTEINKKDIVELIDILKQNLSTLI